MASANENTALSVEPREPGGSRATRRLRRTGQVPGVVYGGGEDPVSFSVDAHQLWRTLQRSGAVLDLKVGDAKASPVVVKELVRHPVNGATMHLDLIRVRMDRTIQSTTILDLTGVEAAPGIVEGGVLEQVTRELAIEALPGDIPETIEFDASGLEMGATVTVADLTAPSGITLLDDPETVVASITAPRLQLEDDNEIEQETEVVGEGEAAPEADAAGEGEGDADSGDAPETTEE